MPDANPLTLAPTAARRHWFRDVGLAAGFLYDCVAGERQTLFKRLTGQPVVTSHVTTEPGRQPVAYDLYVPPRERRAPRAALVLTHGFTEEGASDSRLQALARRLARMGWLVMVPQLPQMRRYRLGIEDIEDLETAMRALAARADVAGARVGVLAFSFGAAPVLFGLAHEAIRTRTSFALVFGSCFDVRHAMKYMLTGAYDQAGLSGQVPLEAAGDVRWRFLKGNLHLLPDSPTREHFLRMLDARIADPSVLVDPTVFSEPERELFALIENRDPDRFESLYAPAAPRLDPWIRSLSPVTVASQITTPLVIIHSVADRKTHYSESLALSRAVTNAPPPVLAIVHVFSHVEISLRGLSFASLAREILPSLRLMWTVAVRLVTELRAPDQEAVALQERQCEPFTSNEAE